MPGWEKHSIGYHGDDGKLFYEDGAGFEYGPKFGTGDVVGCGIDQKYCFFTKNGEFIGIANSNMPERSWFPTIGLHSKDERVEVNFGEKPFRYKGNTM